MTSPARSRDRLGRLTGLCEHRRLLERTRSDAAAGPRVGIAIWQLKPVGHGFRARFAGAKGALLFGARLRLSEQGAICGHGGLVDEGGLVLDWGYAQRGRSIC
jgi:hypothetical protein